MAGFDPEVFGSNGVPTFDADVFTGGPADRRSAIAEQIANDPISQGARDPSAGMSWGQRRLAQLGSGFADFGLGARQLFASDKPTTLTGLVTGDTEASKLKREAADKRKLDAGLNTDFAGKALNVAGQVLPSFAIPNGYLGLLGRAAPIAEGAIAGGAMGAFQPTTEGEGRGQNVGLGALGGAAVPAAIAGAKALAKPASNAVTALADKYGIPIGIADVSNSGFVKGVRSVLNDLPIIGGVSKSQDAAKQEAFNRAVGGTFGASEGKLTADVMDAAKGKIGAELDRVWNNNALQVDAPLLSKVQALRNEWANVPEGARLNKWLDDILSAAQPGPNGAPVIAGDVANKLQSKLGRDVGAAQGFMKEALSDLRREFIGAFNRSVTGADVDALTVARTQYKNFKTVSPLLDKAAAGTAGRVEGDVPAGLLSEAVRNSFPNLSSQTTKPALAELAQLGSQAIANRVPQTGGAPRALIQNGLLGGALTGGGLTAGAAPVAAAVGVGAPAAAGLNWMLGSPTIRKMLSDPVKARGLLARPDIVEMLKEGGYQGLLRAPVMAMPGLFGASAPFE